MIFQGRGPNSKHPQLCDVPKAKERFDNEYLEKSEYNLGEGYTKDSVSKLTTGSSRVIEWKCKKHNEIYKMRFVDEYRRIENNLLMLVRTV